MIDGGLRKLFREHLPTVHWISVETGLTEQGVPDSNGCVNGVEFWVEFKKTATNHVPLRSEQVGWLLRRSRAGGRTYVAVRYRHNGGPRKGVPIDHLMIFPGVSAKQLVMFGLRSVRPVFDGALGPSRWDWKEVLALLSR